MFDKIGRLAEAAATNVSVSRRGFLARLGQSALGVVGVLAGFTATAATAMATIVTPRTFARRVLKRRDMCFSLMEVTGPGGPEWSVSG